MLIQKSFKVEIDPNQAQSQILRQHVGARRKVYNWMLDQCIFAIEHGLKRPTAYDLRKRFVAEVKYTPDWFWYEAISSCVEDGASSDLEKAFKKFDSLKKQNKQRKKSTKKTKPKRPHAHPCQDEEGFPKFRKKKDGAGFFIRGAIKVTPDSIVLPKIGRIKLKEREYIPTGTRIKRATVSTRGGRWFVSCLCEIGVEPDLEKSGVVGVDLGVKHAITLSTGDVIDAPRPLKRYQRKLRKLQKSVSRKEKGSNRRYAAVKKVNRLHARIANIRADFIHNLTTSLVKTKQTIVIEDLNVSGMLKNHRLAYAISDVGFYEIRRQLEYKTKWYGGELIIADRWYPSSKLCFFCGYKNIDLKLSDRDWECPQCGALLDRDVNAALNLAALAVKPTESINGRGGVSSRETLVASPQHADEASIRAYRGDTEASP